MPEEYPKYPKEESTNEHRPSHKRSPFFWVLIILAIIVVFFVVSAIIGHNLTHEGTVTSFSPKSITIKPSNGGTSETFTITSQTMEQKGPGKSPTAYNVKDIHDGEVVNVATSGLHSKRAGVILLFAQS